MTPEEALAFIGFAAFKNKQREIIENIAREKKDYIVSLPTGYGKSLLYTIPIVMSNHPALIVSPLVSLIHDQCKKMNSVQKLAYNISSSCEELVSDEDLVFSPETMAETGPMMLFTTPEKIATNSFREKLQLLHAHRPFSYFVLDEAHLVEQGMGFRPDYLKLSFLRELDPDIPILCFSATCDTYCQGLLKRTLSLREATVVVERERRENMHLSMHYCSKVFKNCTCKSRFCTWKYGSDLLHPTASKLISASQAGNTLVLINSRKDCEALFEDTKRMFQSKTVEMYHGQMPDEHRTEIQKRFVCGEIDCLVATWASFGTGVDMPLVDNIVMYGIPSAFETFMQTIGRGGRANQEFYVNVFVREADVVRQRAVVKNESENQSLQASFRKHIQSSFENMLAVLNCANSGQRCLSSFLEGVVGEERQCLNVSFHDRGKIKSINRRVPAVDRAHWDPVNKTWYLGPGSFHPLFVGFGAKRPADMAQCKKCSVCMKT